jgi:hypothetical protein
VETSCDLIEISIVCVFPINKTAMCKRTLDELLLLSPFIAPHATETCHALALYGGGVLGPAGVLEYAVVYRKKEGVYIPRLVHVERVDTGEHQIFILDEVTGEYMYDTLRLWPLAPEAATRVPEVYQRLGHGATWIVEQFLEDVLPICRPAAAHHEQLRRQVLYSTEDRHVWNMYWTAADTLQRQRARTQRFRPNVWVKRRCRPVIEREGDRSHPILVD